MTSFIKPKAPYKKKPWSLISNKSNTKVWNWEKINYTKESKKLSIKRMGIKINIKINLKASTIFFYWRVKLKRKITLTKRLKNYKK
jgi:hypothetical protein